MRPQDWNSYQIKRRNKRSTRRALGAISFLAVLVLLAMGIGYQKFKIPTAIAPAAQIAVELPPEPPILKMSLYSSDGLVGGKLTFTNTNKYPVRNPTVNCNVVAAGGTVIHNYSFIIFARLEPEQPKAVAYNFGFWPEHGKSLNCWSTSATRAS